MTKTTYAALSLAAAAILSGCGATDTESKTISGRAIDPYLVGATVCLADDNQTCLSDEAAVTTDNQGRYTLTVSGQHFAQSHRIVVTGGTDSEANATFRGTLVALHEANATASLHVSPLSTWLVAAYEEANATTSEARAQIKRNLKASCGIDFDVDIVAAAKEGNTTGLKAAVKLARSAELYDINDTFGFYRALAKEDSASVDARIRGVSVHAHAQGDCSNNSLEDGVNRIIDEVNGAEDNLSAIAHTGYDALDDFMN